MTLDDAIQHLKETLSDENHEWSCEECKQEHKQLLEWLTELKRLHKCRKCPLVEEECKICGLTEEAEDDTNKN